MTTKTKAKRGRTSKFGSTKAKPPATLDPTNPVALLLIPGRPTCNVRGCKMMAMALKNYNMVGPSHYFAKICDYHKREKTAKKKGMTTKEYMASLHPTRKFKKDYCENRDGRLKLINPSTGKIYKCTNTILDVNYHLEADHIRGNHNKKATADTIQTLCVMCHKSKTYKNGDNVTPRYSSSKWSRTKRT